MYVPVWDYTACYTHRNAQQHILVHLLICSQMRVANGTEDWDTAEDEGAPAKDHIHVPPVKTSATLNFAYLARL